MPFGNALTKVPAHRPVAQRINLQVCIHHRRARRQSICCIVTCEQEQISLGLDFGTSGARAVCINSGREVVHDNKVSYKPHTISAYPYWTAAWKSALDELVIDIPEAQRGSISAIAVAGTTTTSVLVDRISGNILVEPVLYNQAQTSHIVEAAAEFVPHDHSSGASVSSLCKLLYWHKQQAWQQARVEQQADPVLLHHADWIASLLTGERDHTDWHNAARLGYDAAAQAYPPWLQSQDFAPVLPRHVHEPGTAIGQVAQDVAQRLGLSPHCTVCAGTTDSVAAFLAAGISQPGEAASSIGSTLAIDLLSTRPVDSAKYGICSYRWGDHWIVDGGSNTGGAVLRQFFSDQQLTRLMQRVDPSTSSGLKYYPLLGLGQRFPVNDPDMQPIMSPRPDDDAMFLQGLLEGIASIEAEAYALLGTLGASAVTKVYTAGGGAASDAWLLIRQHMVGVPVVRSPQAEAAYGAALLALPSLTGNLQ